MNIVHLAKIDRDPFNGVCVVVPEHIKAQQRLASVAFVNLTNTRIGGIKNQLEYGRDFGFSKLEQPFSSPDLVVFHEAYCVEYLKISKELRRRGIPYIIIPHGELAREAQRKKWLKKKVANILLFDRFIQNAAAIQCLSKKECENTWHGREKFVETNGIHLPVRTKDSFGADRTRFIYIGRLDVRIKGLDIMLEAVRASADIMRRANASLDIYGPDKNGSFDAVANMIKKKGVSDIVEIHRAVKGKAKERALLGADVFIQSSRNEGMPMGILEALSYGLPCLVTEGTTLGEIVDEYGAGWRCETSPRSVAYAINKAIEEREEYLRISDNARRCAEERFSWENIAADSIESYKRILGKL